MRKSVVTPLALHVLAGVIAISWLLWCFVPLGNLSKGLATLFVIFLASGMVWAGGRRRSDGASEASVAIDLPVTDAQGPLVLVCGDCSEEIFQAQRLRKTAQGWWLRIDDVSQLADVGQGIQEQRPGLAGQLSVMYVCRPGLHSDEAVMRAPLKSLREQAGKLAALFGFSLPVCLSCEFSGPETPWIIIRGDRPLVCPEKEAPIALTDWLQTKENTAHFPLLSLAFAFIRETLIDELEKSDPLYPPVKSFAVVVRNGTIPAETASVWSHRLYCCSALRLARHADDTIPVFRFPDAILPLLLPFSAPAQERKRTRWLVFLLLFCATAALGFSAANNRTLILKVGDDLQRWYAIPANHYIPKARSLASLHQDALLLERWQRQGEPQRYGLGYYAGQRLWPALQQAIDTYVPPPVPETKPVPKIIRLDSMSLFEPGKSELKPGSIKMLVASLIGIKAKAGWLIVVSGHTDNTGSQSLNQLLSLQRAVAVRNWMRDTGDIPESCFAVQGYGDSRPVASNDTPQGRAQNRRVEISLIPQADVCHIPDMASSSPEG